MSYSKVAVIADGRKLDYDIIRRHLEMLSPEWNVKIINHLAENSVNGYNRLLTSRAFWEPLEDYVLIFQMDSMLLRKGIDEFIGKWDFIGAPIPRIGWPAMNGGLSLRSREAMLNVIENIPYHGENEDVYFCNGLELLNGNLPTYEEAATFSCETTFHLGSLGYHNIDGYLTKEQCEQIRNQYA